MKLVIIISTCSKIEYFFTRIYIYIYFKVLTFLESTRQLTRYTAFTHLGREIQQKLQGILQSIILEGTEDFVPPLVKLTLITG